MRPIVERSDARHQHASDLSRSASSAGPGSTNESIDRRGFGTSCRRPGLIALEIGYIGVSAELAASAGDLAQAHGLRGYDAVHIASAALANDGELALVTGDRKLGAAAQAIGISVALTTP